MIERIQIPRPNPNPTHWRRCQHWIRLNHFRSYCFLFLFLRFCLRFFFHYFWFLCFLCYFFPTRFSRFLTAFRTCLRCATC
ncbi:hypothetical protein DZK44_08920 [Enterococcus faecalis]|nr:hypothetical protein [Enterococcus faecalis]MBW3736125.1 hypothetical protein [Enterococcus faecalis]